TYRYFYYKRVTKPEKARRSKRRRETWNRKAKSTRAITSIGDAHLKRRNFLEYRMCSLLAWLSFHHSCFPCCPPHLALSTDQGGRLVLFARSQKVPRIPWCRSLEALRTVGLT